MDTLVRKEDKIRLLSYHQRQSFTSFLFKEIFVKFFNGENYYVYSRLPVVKKEVCIYKFRCHINYSLQQTYLKKFHHDLIRQTYKIVTFYAQSILDTVIKVYFGIKHFPVILN